MDKKQREFLGRMLVTLAYTDTYDGADIRIEQDGDTLTVISHTADGTAIALKRSVVRCSEAQNAYVEALKRLSLDFSKEYADVVKAYAQTFMESE